MQQKIINLDWAWAEMEKAYFDPTPFGTIRSCRRSFKTMGAVRYLIEKMIDEPNSTAIWVETINKNIDRYYERYFKNLIGDITKWNYQKKTLTFDNNSFIDFGSAESPESMEGFEYDYFILNEAGIILKNDSLWDNTLQPMFKNAKGGRVVGTPRGKNKFHKLSKLEGWCHYHFTVYDCPFYTPDKIEEIKQTSPQEAFRQEYMAEFLEGTGSVFRNISNCYTNRKDDEVIQGTNYVMSVDLAKHVDFTVILIADKDTKEVVQMERFNKLDWGIQKKRIINTYTKYKCSEAIIDSTGVGDAIYDDLVNSGLRIKPFKFTNATKNLGVRNLSVAIDNQSIKFYPYEIIVNELELFEYTLSPSGTMRYNAPPGYHDDTVAALILMNELLTDTKEEILFDSFF